ncbi:MAG TPA: hypothetical protein VMT34_09220, partial [Aggregatilineales bacterium]|nr:hypothetical protein [Aggregatilineales bacterium]
MLSLLVLTGSLIPGAVARAQNPISMTAEAGFGGFFRSDRLTPILVTVSNHGADLSADLVLTVTGVGDQYTTHIDLPSGSTKQVFLYGMLSTYTTNVTVNLVSAFGQLASAQSKVRWVPSNDLIYALVTDPSQSAQLKIDFKYSLQRDQANWRLENVPETAEALRALDVLIFSSIDTGQLNARQRLAVQQWALGGGHLIITGGPAWQKSQAGFADLLPLKPADTTTLVSIGSLAAFSGHAEDKLTAGNNPIIVTVGTLASDAEVLAHESSTPLLIRHPYGDGMVDYLTIDPALEPYASWSHADDFWYAVLNTSGAKPTWSNGVVADDRAQSAATFIKGLRLPDVAQLCGFLGIYIILIGPLNYLILKRIGRRELAWVTIPLIIVGYSIVAYITGFSLRGTQPTLNRLSVVRAWAGQPTARVDGIVGVLSPRRATYTLNAEKGLALRSIHTDFNVAPGGGVSITETPRETLDFSAQSIVVNAGLIAAFSAGGAVESQPLEGFATITLGDGSPTYPSRLSATFNNSTGMTLSNVVILYPGGSESVGSLAPGATKTLNSLTLLPGTMSSPQWNGNGLGNGNNSRYTYYSNPRGNCGYEDPTIEDIMGRNCVTRYYGYYQPYGSSNPEMQEFQREQLLLDS